MCDMPPGGYPPPSGRTHAALKAKEGAVTEAGDSVEPPRAAPIDQWPGKANPLGAGYDGSGTKFAVFSEVAETVEPIPGQPCGASEILVSGLPSIWQ
jgi:hypothetical protein